MNLLYILKNYHPSAKKTSIIRREQHEDTAFSNLFIWDINTQQKTKLFSDRIAKEEQIQKIIFEQGYSENEQQIIFNTNVQLLNNQDIPLRQLKNNLLIESYHSESETHKLWMTNKFGEDLRQIAVLSRRTQWHLDVGNNVVRIFKHSDRDVEIQELPW